MIRFAASRPSRLGTGLILALLLGGFAPAQTARAGCGDHLLAHRVDAPDSDSSTPTAPPPPCNGPSCSRPEQMPLTTSSVKVALPEVEACLSEPSSEAGLGRSGWLRADAPACPTHDPDPVFHPPR